MENVKRIKGRLNSWIITPKLHLVLRYTDPGTKSTKHNFSSWLLFLFLTWRLFLLNVGQKHHPRCSQRSVFKDRWGKHRGCITSVLQPIHSGQAINLCINPNKKNECSLSLSSLSLIVTTEMTVLFIAKLAVWFPIMESKNKLGTV